jgi:hypothetical protein
MTSVTVENDIEIAAINAKANSMTCDRINDPSHGARDASDRLTKGPVNGSPLA